MAAAIWLGFWLLGLPDYYQQYSNLTMVVLSVLLIPVFIVAAFKVLGRAREERRQRLGLWLAFYFTVPFAVLDYLYCGLYLGQGWRFVIPYWYLSVFYVIPWLIFVPVAYLARPVAATRLKA